MILFCQSWPEVDFGKSVSETKRKCSFTVSTTGTAGPSLDNIVPAPT